jgi:hypothetical protein
VATAISASAKKSRFPKERPNRIKSIEAHLEAREMPDRTTADEQDKVDQSSHPTDRKTPNDLRSPGGGKTTHPNKTTRRGIDQEVTVPPDEN